MLHYKNLADSAIRHSGPFCQGSGFFKDCFHVLGTYFLDLLFCLFSLQFGAGNCHPNGVAKLWSSNLSFSMIFATFCAQTVHVPTGPWLLPSSPSFVNSSSKCVLSIDVFVMYQEWRCLSKRCLLLDSALAPNLLSSFLKDECFNSKSARGNGNGFRYQTLASMLAKISALARHRFNLLQRVARQYRKHHSATNAANESQHPPCPW